ncbi:hypothetical protein DSO57_1016952, partial [Entomophthora muscae]
LLPAQAIPTMLMCCPCSPPLKATLTQQPPPSSPPSLQRSSWEPSRWISRHWKSISLLN